MALGLLGSLAADAEQVFHHMFTATCSCFNSFFVCRCIFLSLLVRIVTYVCIVSPASESFVIKIWTC